MALTATTLSAFSNNIQKNQIQNYAAVSPKKWQTYSSVSSSQKEESKNNGGLLGGLGYLGEKFATSLVSTFEGIWDYTAGGLAKLFGETFNIDELSDWAEEQIANDWFGDWYSHPEEWYNPSKGWQVAGDIAGGIGSSLPAMAVGMATGGLGTGAMLFSTFATSFLGAAGNATKQAYRETGQLGGKEFGYGALSGFTEGTIETASTLFGFGSGAITKSIAKTLGRETVEAVGKQTLKSVGKNLASEFFGEALEEGLSTFLDPYWKRVTYDPAAKNATPQEIAYSAFVGGMSGLIMGGTEAGAKSGASLINGSKIAKRGGENEVTKLSEWLIEREVKEQTGDETVAAISDTYKKLTDSLAVTGGKAVNSSQRKLLGDLQRENTAAVFKSLVRKSAVNIVNNADIIAERLNAYGYKTADGKPITYTAEQIRAGIDPEKRSSFVKALKNNDVLRSLAVADATGQLMMDTSKFVKASLMGKRLASQVDLNRFVETATREEIRAVSEALKIDNWATLDADTFNRKITEFVENGGVEQYAQLRAEIQLFNSLPAESALGVPKLINAQKEGMTRYGDENIQIAVNRKGNTYTVFDYGTQHLTKNLTSSEVNKLLSGYNTKKADILAELKAQAEAANELRRQAEELDTFARNNIADYKKLNSPNQSMIRKVIREGRAKGIADEDILAYAKISARSGLDVVFNKEANYRGKNESGEDVYADGFYDPGSNRIVVNPESKRVADALLLHELEHAIINGKGGKRLIATALRNTDETTRQNIINRYSKIYEGKGYTEAQLKNIYDDEISAHYAEGVLSNRNTLEKLLEAEPTMKDKILSFFKGAATDYADVPKLLRAAKRYYNTYKKLFDEFSTINQQNNAMEPLNNKYGSYDNKNDVSDNVRTTNDEKAQVSDRQYAVGAENKVRITSEMSDSERADVLRNRTLTVPIYRGQADSVIEEIKRNYENEKKKFGKKAVVEIAEKLGIVGESIDFDDIDVQIELSKSNLKESVVKEADPAQVAKLLPILSQTAKDAVHVERHNNRYYYDTDTEYVDNLMGAYVDGDSLVPIRFGLKYSKMGRTTLYVLVDQNKIALDKLGKIKNDRGLQDATADKSAVNSLPRSVTYSIPQILSFVNSKDLLRYIPDDLLNSEQISVKREAVAETQEYTNRKNDEKYAKFVREGKERAAKQMLSAKAKSEGYSSDLSYQGSLAFNGAAPSSNAYFSTKEERIEAFERGDFEGDYSFGDFVDNGLDGNDLEWQLNNPIAASGRDRATLASLRNLSNVIRQGKRTIKMYRAVDSKINENSFRNGDWVTPSREYAERHIGLQDWESGRIIEQEVPIDDIWWNGDDINEWGYDNGDTSELYRNTENNVKTSEITYDDEGKLIPISKRYDSRNPDKRYALNLDTEESSARRAKAAEQFGTTSDYNMAGFVLADGRMLKLSQYGQTGVQHKRIESVYDDVKGDAAINRFIQEGNVRVKASAPGIEIGTERAVTTRQLNAISRFISSSLRSRGRFFLDITDPDGKEVASVEYDDNSATEDVMFDIKDYYQRGALPSPTVRYALNFNDDDGAVKNKVSYAEPDKVTMSKGALQKKNADYKSDKTYSRKDVAASLEEIELFKSLPSAIRNDYINSVWNGLNSQFSGSKREAFIDVKSKQLYQTFLNETHLLDNLDRTETDKISDNIVLALRKLLDKGAPSARAKLEAEFNTSDAGFWKKQYNEATERNRVIGQLMSKAQQMKDLKLGTFDNVTQHHSEIFKNSIEELSRIQWRGNLSVTATRKVLDDLKKWYTSKDVKEGLLAYTNELSPGIYVSGVADTLEALTENQGGFTVDELKMLLDVMSYFTNFVENWGKVFRAGKWVEAKPEAQRYIDTLHANEKIKGGMTLKFSGTAYTQMFGDPMTVARRMDMYESGFYTEIMTELRNAAVDAQVAEMELRKSYDEFLDKNKKYVEKASSETVQYLGADIPRIQLIGLYMTMKRRHSWAGLAENGFTFTDVKGNKVRVNGSMGPGDTRITDAELTEHMKKRVAAVEALLTDTDKQYIAILEQAFNVEARKLKADRDMQRLGFTNATNDYYYPIRRANTAKNVDTSVTSELDRVSNSSFNKDTVKGAKQELFIESADSVFNRHIHAVCQYAYLSPAVEAYNVLYNMDVSGNSNKPISIRTESANAWAKGNDYFTKLISDIQGIPAASGEGMKTLASIRGGYAKYQLGANPKVWLTQLSSIFASSSLLDAASITRGMTVSSKGIDEYCSLAKLRNYDNTAAMAQGVLDSKAKRAVNAVGKFSDVLMAPIGKMDRFVVGRIFGACQVQVEKNGGAKVGTEANKIEAGKLLRQVILETQQNSIATERSAAMRSGNEIMRTLTMFSADSMKVIGRVIDGYGEVSALHAKIKATTDADTTATLKKQLKAAHRKERKAIGALIMSAAFMAGIAQLFRHIYDKEQKEDESVAETMLADFGGNLIGGLPLIRDLYSRVIDGYEVDNYAYSVVNDLLDSSISLFDASKNIISGEGSAEERNRAWRNLSYSAGQILGVPTRNVYNVLYGLTKRFSPETAYVIDSAFYKKNYQNDLYRAIEKGDDEMATYILGLLTGERMNEDMDATVFNEILNLSKSGQKVLPRSVPTSITIDNTEYMLSDTEQAQIKSIYAGAEKALKTLFSKPKYNSLSDEQKAAAIDYVYDIYYQKALADTFGDDRNAKSFLISDLVGAENLALLSISTKGIESDVDRDGNVISGSKRQKVVAAINSLNISIDKKLLLICAKGYSLKDNDIRGVKAGAAKKRLLRYILSLSGKTKAEKAALAEMCGFEVKNGKIITKNAFN